MKNKESIRKILKLVYSYDEDFIKEWPEIKRKGMLRFIIKYTIMYTIMWTIMGVFFFFTNRSMYGYEHNKVLSVASSTGVITGVLCSLIFWGMSENRYEQLKEKEAEDCNKNLRR